MAIFNSYVNLPEGKLNFLEYINDHFLSLALLYFVKLGFHLHFHSIFKG